MLSILQVNIMGDSQFSNLSWLMLKCPGYSHSMDTYEHSKKIDKNR